MTSTPCVARDVETWTPWKRPLCRRSRFFVYNSSEIFARRIVMGIAAGTPKPTEKRLASGAKATSSGGAIGILRKLGPGLITGASDDDPSGIATYMGLSLNFIHIDPVKALFWAGLARDIPVKRNSYNEFERWLKGYKLQYPT